jgi:hypothetical protein
MVKAAEKHMTVAEFLEWDLHVADPGRELHAARRRDLHGDVPIGGDRVTLDDLIAALPPDLLDQRRRLRPKHRLPLRLLHPPDLAADLFDVLLGHQRPPGALRLSTCSRPSLRSTTLGDVDQE